MPSFLVETYLARGAARERAACERRIRSVAAELTRSGAPVSFDGSIHVPEDEICFFVFLASTAQEAAVVARQAGLDPLRVVAALPSRKEK